MMSALAPLPLITHPCNVCCKSTILSCSRCLSAWYCCPDHMSRVSTYCDALLIVLSTDVHLVLLQDWSNHKHECRPIAPIPYPLTPSDSLPVGSTATFSALILPVDEDRPRIIKVDCLAETQSSGPCLWSPIARPHVGGSRQPASMIVVHGVGGAPLRFPLHVFYRSDTHGEEPPVNQSIFRLTSSGRSKHVWRGNVVALKFSGTRRQGYTDITMNDLSSLVAYFLH